MDLFKLLDLTKCNFHSCVRSAGLEESINALSLSATRGCYVISYCRDLPPLSNQLLLDQRNAPQYSADTGIYFSCESVIILWSAEGVIVPQYPSEVLQDLLMFHLFDGRSDSWCFQSLCPVVSLARATKQTNIIVSVASRNVSCGLFQSMLLVCLATYIQ